MDMQRLFIALPVPKSSREDLGSLRDALLISGKDPDFRGITHENFHLTVRFLGDTKPEYVPSLRALIRELARDTSWNHGDTTLPPDTRIRGVGAFPSVTRARVIWAGVTGADAFFQNLVTECNRRLDATGLPPDRQKSTRFHPHITIAYVRSRARPREVSRRLRKMQNRHEVCIPVVWPGIALVESTLTPSGAVYRVIENGYWAD
jgi:RNA 2',3'-cyclic 3'-phosphodiesterase